MAKLRWEKTPNAWGAFSGSLQIGTVVKNEDGSCSYAIQAVSLSHIDSSIKQSGDCSSLSSGRSSINLFWQKWLHTAGLGAA
jgi:hypothetical protein